MGFYINKDLEYYEGDKSNPNDIEVTQRPNSMMKWSGTEWVIDKDKIEEHAIDRVQAFMDAKAKELGYDHILSASSYVTSTSPKFKAEGIAFAKWRDDVWLHCYSVLAEWEAGTSKITTEDELIASLPEFTVEY